MTLTELRYIVAVARERHFGRAAEACFVSQPTLSVAIKKLEEELNVQIFERSGAEVVVINAAGCGAMCKEYGHLLHDDPAWAERAAAFSILVEKSPKLAMETVSELGSEKGAELLAMRSADDIARLMQERAREFAATSASPAQIAFRVTTASTGARGCRNSGT